MFRYIKLLKKKKFLLFFLLTISIPLTVNLLFQRQDLRQQASGSTDCSTTNDNVTTEEMQFFEQANTWRIHSLGRQSMNLSAPLNKAAQWFAEAMDAGLTTGHIDQYGRGWNERFRDCGYDPYYSQAGGEALAVAGSVVEAVEEITKDTPGHQNGVQAPVDWSCGGVGKSGNSWVIVVAQYSSANCPGNTGITPSIPSPTPLSTIIPSPSPTGPVTDVTPVPSGGMISLIVSLPGIGERTWLGENSNPSRNKRPVYIQVLETPSSTISSTLAYSASGSAYMGNIAVPQSIPTGSYDLVIKMEETLLKKTEEKVLIEKNSTITVPRVLLISGDFNGNNEIEILDYNIFIGCYGNKTCPAKEKVDLNSDGVIDEVDLNILLSGFLSRFGD